MEISGDHRDWDDAAAREALVDALARDGQALLAVPHDRKLDAEVQRASELLATVLGQDLETTDDGRFRIARRMAEDRVSAGKVHSVYSDARSLGIDAAAVEAMTDAELTMQQRERSCR